MNSMLSSERVLVTGANGFVGSWVVRKLLEAKAEVIAFVRARSKVAKELRDKVIIAEGDLVNFESLLEAAKSATSILHIGATFREAAIRNTQYYAVNAGGTRNVLEAAKQLKIKRVIHCSTTGVHGDVGDTPVDEDYCYAPLDVYQESKVEAEKIALSYYHSHLVNGVIIRPAMIYGPEDTRLFKIFKMVKQRRFFFLGDGSVKCHFIDVRDLADAFLLALQNETLNNRIYTIAGREIVSLKEAVNQIANELKTPKPWLHLPALPLQLMGGLCEMICKPLAINPPLYRRRVDFYVKNRCFITKRAEKELGFKAQKSFSDEIKDICTWYLKNGWL
jgi:nucleoside-diphosphate-sugar epimerase